MNALPPHVAEKRNSRLLTVSTKVSLTDLSALEEKATLAGLTMSSYVSRSEDVTSCEPIRRRHVLTLDKLHRRAPLTDEADAAVHDQETLCRIGSLAELPGGSAFVPGRSLGLTPTAPPKRHKVVLGAPGCAAVRVLGRHRVGKLRAAPRLPRASRRGGTSVGARAANSAPASPSLATGPLCGGPFFRPHRHACAAPGRRGVRRCAARGHRSQRSSASAASPLLADPVRRC